MLALPNLWNLSMPCAKLSTVRLAQLTLSFVKPPKLLQLVYRIAQVDGKLKDTFELSVDATEDDLKAAADNSRTVQKALEGREVVKVIIRAPKLINIVTKG